MLHATASKWPEALCENRNVLCPACTTTIAPQMESIQIGQAAASDGRGVGYLYAQVGNCPACSQLLVDGEFVEFAAGGGLSKRQLGFIFPQGLHLPPRSVPDHVPPTFAAEFAEAAEVGRLSAKAGAALGRRLLQRLLREAMEIRARDLNTEIDRAIESGRLPGQLADDLDAIRTVGNFAAHPVKSEHTGEIVEVEDGEAEWILDVLADLLEELFTKQKLREDRREALNRRLAAAGKPPLKSTTLNSGDT